MEESRDWGIASGIGITALGVAAARAVEASRPDPLVRDPYAAGFVHAANAPVALPTRVEDVSEQRSQWDLLSLYMGLRSRFFDEYFAGPGPTQAVILASGLDTRAFRLPWVEGTTMYEIDLPRVLEFKDQVLVEQNARPGCDRHIVAVDLRDDWRTALLDAGFDPATPTAWLAEGLMMYLSGDAAGRLLTTVDELSAPGSAIAVEYADDIEGVHADVAELVMATDLGVDPAALLPDESFDPNAWLAKVGWELDEVTCGVVGARYGRPFPAEAQWLADASHLLVARKP